MLSKWLFQITSKNGAENIEVMANNIQAATNCAVLSWRYNTGAPYITKDGSPSKYTNKTRIMDCQLIGIT